MHGESVHGGSVNGGSVSGSGVGGGSVVGGGIILNNGKQAWTESEDEKLVRLVEELGTNWTLIETHFNGRTKRAVNSRWHGYLKHNAHRFSYQKKVISLIFFVFLGVLVCFLVCFLVCVWFATVRWCVCVCVCVLCVFVSFCYLFFVTKCVTKSKHTVAVQSCVYNSHPFFSQNTVKM